MTCIECVWDAQDSSIELEKIEPHSLTRGNHQQVGISLRYFCMYECTECGRTVEVSGVVNARGDSFA